VRNGIQLGFLPRALRTAIHRELNDSTIQPDKRIAHHLGVFNGLKGLCMILTIWGFTFYFSWYSVISNLNDANDMSNTLLFNIVSCCVYTVPTFFFCSGFLQTFAFMQRDKKGSMFTWENLGPYYFRKIFRFMPLNVICMMAVLFILPVIGSGPVWNTFKSGAIAGCTDNWWTNVLWVNNLYPRNYDDKCLPWTWFVPCYVQLSLIVPPLLAIYKFADNKLVPAAMFILLIFFALIGQFSLVYFTDVGATMVRND